MKFFLLIPLLSLFSTPVFAEDMNPASFLKDNCMKCHGTEVYTRADRRVKSLAALKTQVTRCTSNLRLQLFDEEIDQLADYMNSQYYKF